MKKISLLFVVAFISFSLQSIMADTQTITTDVFSSENKAVVAAQGLSNDLKNHKYSVLAGKTVAQCKSITDLKVQGFRVVPVWVQNGENYKKGYQAEVKYNFSCETKNRGPLWYASVKGF